MSHSVFVLESRLPGACPGREIVRSEDVFSNVCNTSDMSKPLKMMNTYTIMMKKESNMRCPFHFAPFL